MASTTGTTAVCSDCDLRKITKPSSHWCPVCEEKLCTDCNDHHKLRKLTRDHSTIPIEYYHQLPEDILNIKQYCQEHDERYQMFCKVHDSPICSNCLKTHTKCVDNIVPFGDVVSSPKTSEAFGDVMSRLTDLGEKIKKIQNDKENNIKSIKEQRQKCEKDICSIRKQITEHIDRIETQILLELSTAEDKITSNINTVLENLKEKQKAITECIATMQDMEQFASDLQTFVGVKDIESRVRKYEQIVDKIIEDRTLEDKTLDNMQIIIDAKIKHILDEVKIFGSVEVSTIGSSVRIVSHKDKQTQFVTEKDQNINEIQVKNGQKIFEFDRNYFIRGAHIVLDEEIIFSCQYPGQLIVVSTDGSLKFCHSLEPDSYAFNIKYLDIINKTAVYTLGQSDRNCLSIIDFTNRKVLNTINFQGEPYGLAVTEGYFLVAVKGIGIQSVDRSNHKISTIISRGLLGYTYVAAFDGNVYFTDRHSDHKVTCCDMTGQIIWEFENKYVLDSPYGLAVDNHRNVYVAGGRFENVIVISPDGVHYKQVLTEHDGLTEPTGICFDRKRNKLLVANCEGAAYLYDII